MVTEGYSEQWDSNQSNEKMILRMKKMDSISKLIFEYHLILYFHYSDYIIHHKYTTTGFEINTTTLFAL